MERLGKLKQYVIPEGWHNSIGNKLRFHSGFDEYCFVVLPGNNLWYNNLYISGINKLCGFTLGGLYNQIHHNSIRIGWKADAKVKDYINLYVYWYNSKASLDTYNAKFICRASVKIAVCGRITKGDDNFTVKLFNGEHHTMIIPYEYPNNLSGRYCYPYFGGQSVAPKTYRFGIFQEMRCSQ